MKKLLTVLLKSIIFFIGWTLCVGLIPVPESDDPAVWRFWAELIPFLSIAALSYIFWLVEKKKISLHIFDRPLYSILIGIITGALWLGLSVGILALMGVIRIEGGNSIPLFWLWLISALLNTIMQELLVRGYLYRLIKYGYSTVAAAVVTTALFTLMHGGAFEAGIIPVLNVVTMSLFMTAVMEYTGSLTAPIVMHFLWNGVGSIILGGVSLADDYPHLLNMTFAGNRLLSGGIYKIEGSIIVLLLNMLFTAIFVLSIRKRRLSR